MSEARILWTDERVAALKNDLAAGRSYAQMAQAWRDAGFDVSRNSLIGKARRLGLVAATRPRRTLARGTVKIRRVRLTPRRAPAPAPVRQPPPSPLRIALLNLRRTHCRWPAAGAGAATLFCGHAAVPGKSYCPAHQAAGVKPARQARRRPEAGT